MQSLCRNRGLQRIRSSEYVRTLPGTCILLRLPPSSAHGRVRRTRAWKREGQLNRQHEPHGLSPSGTMIPGEAGCKFNNRFQDSSPALPPDNPGDEELHRPIPIDSPLPSTCNPLVSVIFQVKRLIDAAIDHINIGSLVKGNSTEKDERLKSRIIREDPFCTRDNGRRSLRGVGSLWKTEYEHRHISLLVSNSWDDSL